MFPFSNPDKPLHRAPCGRCAGSSGPSLSPRPGAPSATGGTSGSGRRGALVSDPAGQAEQLASPLHMLIHVE